MSDDINVESLLRDELDELRGRLADADGAIRELSRMNADTNARLCEFRAWLWNKDDHYMTGDYPLSKFDELFPEAKEGGEG